jgi:polyphosphate kinase
LEKGTRTVAIDLLSFGPERFSSRELSRLEFGSRLLDLGEDQRLPILERFKFVAIFADMVDEFFQVRVVSLEDKVAAGVQTPSVDGIRPRQQLVAIRERVLSLVERQDRLVLDVLLPELASAGIAVVRFKELDEPERELLAKYFNENVYPVSDALGRRPRSPVSHDFQPVAQHRGYGARRHHRRGAQRPREGAELTAEISPGKREPLVLC